MSMCVESFRLLIVQETQMFMVDLIIESNKPPMPRPSPMPENEYTGDNSNNATKLETIERLLLEEEERMRSINPEDIRGKLKFKPSDPF